MAAVAEAHFFQRLARQRLAFAIAHAAVAQRQLHLLQRSQCREQVEALEHEADMVQAEALHLAAGHVAHVLAQRVHATAIRRGQAGQQRQQRALAAPRRARDQGQLARIDVQRQAAQHRHLHIAGHEAFFQCVGLQRGGDGMFGGHRPVLNAAATMDRSGPRCVPP